MLIVIVVSLCVVGFLVYRGLELSKENIDLEDWNTELRNYVHELKHTNNHLRNESAKLARTVNGLTAKQITAANKVSDKKEKEERERMVKKLDKVFGIVSSTGSSSKKQTAKKVANKTTTKKKSK